MPSSDINRPPPRRKSCGECVKAKRRCDQQAPSCSRCRKKGFDCIYVAPPSEHRRLRTPATPQPQFDFSAPPDLSTHPAIDFDQPMAYDSVDGLGGIDFSAPFDLSWDSSAIPNVDLLERESVFNNMNWMSGLENPPADMALVRSPAATPLVPVPSGKDRPVLSNDRDESICVRLSFHPLLHSSREDQSREAIHTGWKE